MSIDIDRKPPPKSLREIVEALQPGESALVHDGKLGSIRPVVSRIKKQHARRKYRTGMADDGPRVWRLA